MAAGAPSRLVHAVWWNWPRLRPMDCASARDWRLASGASILAARAMTAQVGRPTGIIQLRHSKARAPCVGCTKSSTEVNESSLGGDGDGLGAIARFELLQD